MLSLKKAVAIFFGVLCLFAIAAGIGSQRAPADSAASAAPAPTAPALSTAEQRFIDQLAMSTDLENSPDNTPDHLIKVGRQICTNIGLPGVTHATLLVTIVNGNWGPNSIPLLTAAQQHLCPGRVFAPTVVETTTAAADAGPVKAIAADDERSFEVGPEMVAGKWESTGGNDSCYWERLSAGPDQEIIDNDLGTPDATVWVRDGEYFSAHDCGSWEWVADK